MSIPSSSSEECSTECCSRDACAGFVFVTSAPSDFNGCKKGEACCYLKSMLAPKKAAAFQAFSSPKLRRVLATLASKRHLMECVRQSHLGEFLQGGRASCGWAASRVDYCQSKPWGRGKSAAISIAHFFGALVGKGPARVLQTHPDASLKAPGVAKMAYAGAYPSSRISIQDPALHSIDLYAYSSFKVNDMEYSSRPAAAFSLQVDDDGAGFMFQLPLAIEPDQVRSKAGASPAGTSTKEASKYDCKRSCDANSSCTSWSFVEATARAF